MDIRTQGYSFLRGHGLEIGALHHPAQLPPTLTVDYFDAITKQQAVQFFPEVPAELIVDPTYLGDLDKGDLRQFADEQFDFVILSHVIEHVANPLNVIADVFRIVRVGGHVVLACPDKRFTFDKHRDLTPFLHLALEFHNQVDHVTDDHYRDFLAGIHPHILSLPEDQIAVHLASVRARREHAHVWDSNTFRAFLVATLSMFNENATCLYESFGHENQLEYFSVWRRDPKGEINQVRGSNGKQLQGGAQPIQELEEDLRAQAQQVTALERMIEEKNQHILYLESLIQQITDGRVMRLVQRLRRLRT